MKYKRYLWAVSVAIGLIWPTACAHDVQTRKEEPDTSATRGEIQFDFAGGISLPVVKGVEKKTVTLRKFRVGTGKNRMLIAGVQVEEGGKENEADMGISSVVYGSRTLTLIPGSEVELSSMWRGKEYFLKVALYYLINPPSGTHDITVTYAGKVPSGNLGAISFYNVKQEAPLIRATNKQTDQSKKSEIITKVTTKNDGSWVVDIVGCGKKSKLETKTKDHIRRYNSLEKTGTRSSLAGGTLLVPTAGEVTLHWIQKRLTVNRLAHVVVEIAPER